MNRSLVLTGTILSALLLSWTQLAAAAEAPGRIAESADSVCPLLPGAQAPDAEVRDLEGTSVSLRSLLSTKPRVLIFFRGGTVVFSYANPDYKVRFQSELLLAAASLESR